jgi:hypothetical protein
MPCFKCGARQTDPVRGASPWKRGVRRDHQVLVCPECQAAPDWAAGLDHCAVCDSALLICRLGEVECRSCGHVRDVERESEDLMASAAPGLSEDVAQALARVLKSQRA